MKEDKNIDRLFQEKLKDFEFVPSPLVWENIEQKLNKKKKRRILPFWFFGGVAASIIIGISLLTKSNLEPKIKKNKNTNVVENTKTIDTTNNEKEKLINNTPIIEIADSQEYNTRKTPKKLIKKQENKIETTVSVVNKNTENETEETEQKVAMTKKTLIKTDERFNDSQINKKINRDDKKIAITKNSVDEQTKEKTQKKRKENKNLLEEPFKDEEVEVAENKKLNSRWKLQPTFGILTSKSYGKGSPIDSKFNNNTISGKNTQSYGLKVSYQINKKWTLQSGLHLQELEFNTQNIVVSSGVLSVSSSSNIIKNNDDELFYNTPDETSNTSPINKNNGIYIDNEISTDNGILNQKYGYLELPIEIKYSFLQKNKFDFSTVTGFSSLILAKNQIALENRGNSKVFGEATNLNPINFSINLGLDLNYSLNKKLNLNISPMFKTPLNTFSENSNGFKPYYIGIYTGIRYSF